MFQFEIINALWLLIAVPLILLTSWLIFGLKKKTISKVGHSKVFTRLFPDWSIRREWLKVLFFALAIAALSIAWANPQWGNRKQKIKAKSSDVIIALDISQSMLAEDVSPNRMERAKRFVNELIKSLKGERIGLVFFAGSAYLQMPLSHDYASAEVFIKAASPKQAGTQGTVIADAIELSSTIFGNENPTQKALIIISDGENHESEAIAAAQNIRSEGTFVYTLGIGSQEGAHVPVMDRGKITYKKDKEGNIIKSTLNTQLLQDVAQAGGGKFYMIDQTFSALKKLDNEIERLEKQDVEQRSFTDFNSYFQYFLLIGLLALIVEYFIKNYSNRKNSWREILGI